jgi:hypothetical protein
VVAPSRAMCAVLRHTRCASRALRRSLSGTFACGCESHSGGVTCSDVYDARVQEKKLCVKSTTCGAICRTVQRGLWTCSRVHRDKRGECAVHHVTRMHIACTRGLSTRRVARRVENA